MKNEKIEEILKEFDEKHPSTPDNIWLLTQQDGSHYPVMNWPNPDEVHSFIRYSYEQGKIAERYTHAILEESQIMDIANAARKQLLDEIISELQNISKALIPSAKNLCDSICEIIKSKY